MLQIMYFRSNSPKITLVKYTVGEKNFHTMHKYFQILGEYLRN